MKILYIKNSILGILTFISAYDIIDNTAILFLAKNEYDDYFLCFCLSILDFKYWSYAEINFDTLYAFESKEITSAEAFRQYISLYHVELNGEDSLIKEVDFSGKLIPPEGQFAVETYVIYQENIDFSSLLLALFSEELITPQSIKHKYELDHLIFQWIFNYGSKYLKQLYINNFFFLRVFIDEFLSDFFIEWEAFSNEWKIMDAIEDCLTPCKQDLDDFIAQKEILSSTAPFEHGILKLFESNFILYIGYKIFHNIYMVKEL